jgi:hypothetical protein
MNVLFNNYELYITESLALLPHYLTAEAAMKGTRDSIITRIFPTKQLIN